MDIIKSFDCNKKAYVSIFSVRLSWSFGLLLNFSKTSLISVELGLGVVNVSYSLQRFYRNINVYG